jgi:Protein of unknown function (DUF1761)
MPIQNVNHRAAIVAAVAYWLWGALWFTVFGKQWIDLTHRSDANAADPVPYVVSILMAFVLSYGTAIALSHDADRTALGGVQFGVFVGLLFLASTQLTTSVYEGRPLALWVLDGGYEVLGLALVGAIIGAWKKKSVKPRS